MTSCGRVLAVVGTDTGAGKTVVVAGLAAALRLRGLRVAALKPLATGVASGNAGEDATLLARATGAEPQECVLEAFASPRSPLAASRAEKRRIDTDAIVRRIQERAQQPGIDLLIVEGIGGVLVPIDENTTVRDLIRRLDAPVLVAARAGLGTINHCALTVEACRAEGLDVAGVVLSDTDDTAGQHFAVENAAQVAAQCDVAVLGTIPHLDDPGDFARLAAVFGDCVNLDALLDGIARPSEIAEIVALDRAHVWHPFTQTLEWLGEEPLVIRSGQGCWLRATDGRRYLDGISSLWANVHGHAHPTLTRALREQAGKVAHSTFLGQTHEEGARLAAELAAIAPPGLTRVFFSESGAAAVEVALRVSLLAQRHRGQHGRTRFVSLDEAYHGDTAGAVSVGRSEPFHRGLDPLLFEAIKVPPPQLIRMREGCTMEQAELAALDAMRDVLATSGADVAAVVVEPRIQGAAGMWPHSDAWLQAVAVLAHAAGALFVCDEVATGFGRTGDMFASCGAGISPDIITLGKGLSGGYLPISATLVGDELFELFTGAYEEHRTLYYGHTFSGNPLACAVARASLAVFQAEDTLARGRRLAVRLGRGLGRLADLPHVAEVRQRGVMAGLELCAGGPDEPFPAALRVGRQVCMAARRRGVILRPLGDVVVINPPLVMTDDEVDMLVQALAQSIEEVTACVATTQAGS